MSVPKSTLDLLQLWSWLSMCCLSHRTILGEAHTQCAIWSSHLLLLVMKTVPCLLHSSQNIPSYKFETLMILVVFILLSFCWKLLSMSHIWSIKNKRCLSCSGIYCFGQKASCIPHLMAGDPHWHSLPARLGILTTEAAVHIQPYLVIVNSFLCL